MSLTNNLITVNNYKFDDNVNIISNQNKNENSINITDFLKYHSEIDSNFIDDFYSFYDDSHNEYDYTINLEKLMFWLNVRKDNLKTLLESNFVEDKDYIIYKNKDGKSMGYGYNKRIYIMLNYSCAKELCMLSRSEKSSVIRKFYIDLEKLIILSFTKT